MKDYVAATYGWDEALQAELFRRNWDHQLPHLQVVELDARVAGCLRVEDNDAALFLASIEIAPQLQGRGIGTQLIEQLAARARAAGKTLELFVMKANPRAQRLYERLGFAVINETATHRAMRLQGT